MPGGDGPVPPSELLRAVVPWAGRELGAGEEEEERSISCRLLANSGMPSLHSKLPLASQQLPPRAKQKYRF